MLRSLSAVVPGRREEEGGGGVLKVRDLFLPSSRFLPLGCSVFSFEPVIGLRAQSTELFIIPTAALHNAASIRPNKHLKAIKKGKATEIETTEAFQ